MMIRSLTASAVIALACLIGMVGMAPPASAHSVSGVGATNWKTVLTKVAPVVPGVTIKVVEDGSRLELINHGPEILVYGYEGEPYLRVGPLGVFINTLSPAAYLNCSRKGCPVPSFANATAKPKWEKISSGQMILWHDHRTHWMGSALPPDVVSAPGARHVQAHWTVSMAQGSTVISASGYYVWQPGPSFIPWLPLLLGLCALGLVLALTRSFRWLAVATGVVAAVDLGHAIVISWFWAGNWVYKVSELFEGSSYQIPGWVLGFLAVRLLWKHRAMGAKFAAVAGASAVLFTGAFDFTVLDRSQAPFDGSILVDRICVSICLGLGLGVLLGAVWLLRADRPGAEEAVAGDDDVAALPDPSTGPPDAGGSQSNAGPDAAPIAEPAGGR